MKRSGARHAEHVVKFRSSRISVDLFRTIEIEDVPEVEMVKQQGLSFLG